MELCGKDEVLSGRHAYADDRTGKTCRDNKSREGGIGMGASIVGQIKKKYQLQCAEDDRHAQGA